MKRKIYFLLACITMACMLSACSAKTAKQDEEVVETKQEEEVVLSEKQKKILKEAGLPQNYDELDAMQQINIRNIGLMLDYIENKYDKEFEFYKFYADSTGLETPSLEVYPVDDSECIVTVKTVTKSDSKKVTYTDDYMELQATSEYEQAVKNCIAERFQDAEFEVFSTINSMEEGERDVLSKASAVTYVCMVDPFEKEEDALKAAEEVINYIKEKNGNKPLGIYYYMQTEEQFNQTYITSADDDFSDVEYKYRMTTNNNAARIEEK
ncbi:MAG: hypothetical protein E7272_11370 [Pseudobutyrivibrio ruminis]|uniref:Uncharacterized protein n=1 Tax=Pseudobutyrivibrio ruminis TaxID=46206 RepID=A0A927U8Q2_9FIRM|nr:hypothetical protein [Pseudobutyrivibrio ruminis]